MTLDELEARIRRKLADDETSSEVIELVLRYPGPGGLLGVARALGLIGADEA